ncbi:T-complex protein 1 subunit alpha-like [Sinocyclocheilus anshuiensis]|uniref:T-complex protein 1 subunit alpha-like n=1 Tax=Sinocyclocheilus anshuiensis TaxID=1608454 RepID=UPI0007BA2FAF|nr:PREDICTED: T-complex protein 1 subunit alpha-like [Sinocyclocheilus anshuiensis]
MQRNCIVIYTARLGKSIIVHITYVLYSYFNPERKNLKWIGLDLVNGKPRDNKQAGVYEPMMVKTKSLKFATEAAITILRIDDLIKLFPDQKEGGPSYQDAVQSGSLEG